MSPTKKAKRVAEFRFGLVVVITSENIRKALRDNEKEIEETSGREKGSESANEDA